MSNMTPKFRVSYPKLFVPEVNKLSGKTEYSVTAVFPKDTSTKTMDTAIEAAMTKRFGEDKKKWPKAWKKPYRPCEDRMKEGKMPEGYEAGGFFITLKSPVPAEPARLAKYRPPQVFDKTKTLMTDQSNMYGGCYAQAIFNASAYQQGANAGVSFYLEAIIKVADGQPISTRISAEQAFAAIQIDDSELEGGNTNGLFT